MLIIETPVWYHRAVYVSAPATSYLNMVMGKHRCCIIVHITTHITTSFVLITTYIVMRSTIMLSQFTYLLSQFTYFVQTIHIFCLHLIHHCCQSLHVQAASCCLSPMLLQQASLLLFRAHCTTCHALLLFIMLLIAHSRPSPRESQQLTFNVF